MTETNQPTLHEALATMGFTSRKEDDPQRRTVYDAYQNLIDSYTAAEAWDYFRDSLAIIPHRTRPERRATWNKIRRTVTYEALQGDAWTVDYTVRETDMQGDYFQQYYGWPQPNVNPQP